MRNAILGLALLGALGLGTSAHADSPSSGLATVQPVYWNGDGCGPRCRAHQWRRHERWEARRFWHHHRWEERRYGYGTGPRY
jgi:hypothetical protein